MIIEEVAIHRLHRLELYDDELAGQVLGGADEEYHAQADHIGSEGCGPSVHTPQTVKEDV